MLLRSIQATVVAVVLLSGNSARGLSDVNRLEQHPNAKQARRFSDWSNEKKVDVFAKRFNLPPTLLARMKSSDLSRGKVVLDMDAGTLLYRTAGSSPFSNPEPVYSVEVRKLDTARETSVFVFRSGLVVRVWAPLDEAGMKGLFLEVEHIRQDSVGLQQNRALVVDEAGTPVARNLKRIATTNLVRSLFQGGWIKSLSRATLRRRHRPHWFRQMRRFKTVRRAMAMPRYWRRKSVTPRTQYKTKNVRARR